LKKFNVPVDAGGKKVNIDVCVGDPKEGNHPLQNQASWLSKERGATIPKDIMDAFERLLTIARRENVSFEELCQYAFEKYGKPSDFEEGDNSGSGSGKRDLAEEQRKQDRVIE
jgi:hypothetical protein